MAPGSIKDGSLKSDSILSWLSIALAVLTAIFQGLVTALALMTESSTQWTFRFRLATVEHLWWMFVCVLLLTSFTMSAIAFTAGEGGDPVSVLALSSATFIAIVQYAVPAWHHRRYVLTRWYAWTGDSRTGIKRSTAKFCSDAVMWAKLATRYRNKMSRLQFTPSDYYGWRLWRVPGLKIDPADLLQQVSADDSPPWDTEKAPQQIGIYTGPDPNSPSVSLRWGRQQGFIRRVSRAVSSMPLLLLNSHPLTLEGYDGRGLAHAMGILGRNKGLQPWKLVFQSTSSITGSMENSSRWAPRPAKVLRSFYKNAMQAQFGGLGQQYVDAATELSLLLSDVPSWAAIMWLELGLEHQHLETNLFLANTALITLSETDRNAVLAANYECSYVSMIISLNAMKLITPSASLDELAGRRCRPDLTCTALLAKARDHDLSWLQRADVQDVLADEASCLSEHVDWKDAAARLLGLQGWPTGFLQKTQSTQ